MRPGYEAGLFVARSRTNFFASHVKKRFNKRADYLATKAIKKATVIARNCPWTSSSPPRSVQIGFDGGCREGVSSAGWHLSAASSENDGNPNFDTFVAVSVRLAEAGGDSTTAEFFGLCQAVRGLLAWCQHGRIEFDNNCRVKGSDDNSDLKLDI